MKNGDYSGAVSDVNNYLLRKLIFAGFIIAKCQIIGFCDKPRYTFRSLATLIDNH